MFFRTRRSRRRILGFILGFCLIFSALGNAVSAAESIGWYCVHKKGHVQPVADPKLLEVERHGGYYIDRKHSSPDAEDKVVYLTFDAGYENGNVEKILDAMKEGGVSGAFFILGNLVATNPELVARMEKEGHLVCNHTCSHKDMSQKSRGENVKIFPPTRGKIQHGDA